MSERQACQRGISFVSLPAPVSSLTRTHSSQRDITRPQRPPPSAGVGPRERARRVTGRSDGRDGAEVELLRARSISTPERLKSFKTPSVTDLALPAARPASASPLTAISPRRGSPSPPSPLCAEQPAACTKSGPVSPRSRSGASSPRGTSSGVVSPRSDSPSYAYSKPFVKITCNAESKVISATASDTAHSLGVVLLRKLCRHTHGVVDANTIAETKEQYSNYFLHFKTLHGKWELCDEAEAAFRYLDVAEELLFMETPRKLTLHRMTPDELLDDEYRDPFVVNAAHKRRAAEAERSGDEGLTDKKVAMLRMQLSRGDSLLRMDGGRMFVVGDHLEESGAPGLEYDVGREVSDVAALEAAAAVPTVYSYSEVSGDGDVSEDESDTSTNPFSTPRHRSSRGIFVDVDDDEGEAGPPVDTVPPTPEPRSREFAALLAETCVAAPRMPGFFYCADGDLVFEKHKVIGKGGYGVVYKATFRPTGEEVAVKQMPLLNELDPHSKKLATEVKVLALCKHPNIVGFKGCFYSNDTIWLGMNLCSSGSLGEMLRSTSFVLNEDQVQVISKQIVRGLAYLHARGVVHRDVKLDNVLIGEDAVQLADLGVAGVCSTTDERSNSIAGTTYWLAPEMALGGEYDWSADIWSLGITVIELFEKYPPYWDLLPVRQLYMLTSEDVDVPTLKETDHISRDAIDFIAQCLHRKPSLRPSAADLLTHPWLAQGVPARYESIFVQYVASQVSDLLEDREIEDEEMDDGGYGGSGNVIDLSSSDEDDFESSDEEEQAPLVRRAIFLAQEKPIQTLSELVEEMRSGTNPIPMKSRKYRLRTYKHTFVGREAVDWIMVRMGFDTRPEAVALGQLLVKRGQIRHCADVLEFMDSNHIYVFAVDFEKKKPRGPMLKMKTISTKLRGSGEREREHGEGRVKKDGEGRAKKTRTERTASALLSPRSRGRAKRQKQREAERELEKERERDRSRVMPLEQLSALARRMQGAEGVRMCETRVKRSKTQAVYSGVDLLAWVMQNVPGSSEEFAERLLQEMLDAKLLRQLHGGKGFKATTSDMFIFRTTFS